MCFLDGKETCARTPLYMGWSERTKMETLFKHQEPLDHRVSAKKSALKKWTTNWRCTFWRHLTTCLIKPDKISTLAVWSSALTQPGLALKEGEGNSPKRTKERSWTLSNTTFLKVTSLKKFTLFSRKFVDIERSPGEGGGGWDAQQSSSWGGSVPRSDPLPFYRPLLKEKVPLSYSWFATTWQGGHTGGQNKRIFPGRICMKIEFRSRRREMLLFLTTNMAAVTSRANQQ